MLSRVFDGVFGTAAGQPQNTDVDPSTCFSGSEHEFTLKEFAVSRAFIDETLYHAWHKEFDLESSYELLHETITKCQHILTTIMNSSQDFTLLQALSRARIVFMLIVPEKLFESTLSVVLFEAGAKLLDTPQETRSPLIRLPRDRAALKEGLKDLARGFSEVGFAGNTAARAYGRATHDLLAWIINRSFSQSGNRVWSRATAELFIRTTFAPLVKDLMQPLKIPGAIGSFLDESAQQYDEYGGSMQHAYQNWIEYGSMMITYAMADRLYDLVLEGKVYADDILATDLKRITDTAKARAHVTGVLKRDLHRRLLNAASSTVAILDAYVQFILALRRIDQSGVLLAVVAHEINQYLRTRDDTVRIVITSFLEPGEKPDGMPLPSGDQFSGHVSKVMMEAVAIKSVYAASHYPGKDLKNPLWEPAPIDAVGDYAAARYRDTMGHLVAIKDRDAFIEELRSILGERLLKCNALKFDQEERLLTMFKTRFDEFPIRECEIMLRDMQESLAWYKYINSSQARINPGRPEVEVKVLSHTYWPQLRNDSLTLPAPLQALQNWFNREFGAIKKDRNLDWLNSQGRIKVELAFEDRHIVEEVTPAQAAVIYQFQESDDADQAVTIPEALTVSVQDIETITSLEEEVIRAALTFWVSKSVLRKSHTHADSYTVIERLAELVDSAAEGDQPNAEAVAAAEEAAAAAQLEPVHTAVELKTSADLLAENAPLYTAFVVNMLTNQGHMPASKMMMMLKMLVAGGFPFEEAEFVEFLEGLAAQGKVQKAGGLWMVKKA